MAATQIKEMRVPHDSVLDLILAKPFATLRELSAATGYSVSWLSQMIRSDCFRAAYDSRRGDIESAVMQGVGERLNAVAHLAIDRMEDELQKTTDPDFVVDAFDKVLHRAGYAPSAGRATATINQHQNVFLLSKEELGEMRKTIIEGSLSSVSERTPAQSSPRGERMLTHNTVDLDLVGEGEGNGPADPES